MDKVKNKNQRSFPLIPLVIGVLILVIGSFSLLGIFIKNKIQQTLKINNLQLDTTRDTTKLKAGDFEVATSEKESVSWPSDLPINIPKYEVGKIKAVTHVKAENVWVITVSEATEEYFKQYKESLVSGGWQADNEVAFLVNMFQLKKDNYQLTLTYDPSSKGVLISLNLLK